MRGTPPSSGVKTHSDGFFRGQHYNHGANRWEGFGFFAEIGGTLEQQLGECPPGSGCYTEKYPLLWNDARGRWEGAVSTARVAKLVEDNDPANPQNSCGTAGDSDAEKVSNWKCRMHRDIGMLVDGNNDPLPGADWDIAKYTMSSRFDIDISAWAPGPGQLPSVSNVADRCANAGNITFAGENQLYEADSVVIVLDRSKSMAETYTPGSVAQRKLDWATAGINSWLDIAANLSTPPKVGLRVFAQEDEKLYPPGVGNDATAALTSIAASDIKNEIKGLSMDWYTSIGDSVSNAVTALDNDPTTNLGAIFLLSDGEQTAGEKSCEEALQEANASGYSVFWAPIGTAAQEEGACPDEVFGDGSGNEIFDATDPRSLPVQFIQMMARLGGQAMASEPVSTEVGYQLPGIPQTQTIDYDVEDDAEGLAIQLINMNDDLSTWEPRFTLTGPGGNPVITEQSAQWTLQPKKHVGIISVGVPTQGTWTLELDGGSMTKGIPERATAIAMIDHLGPECDVAVTPFKLDSEEDVEIRAVARYKGMPISTGVTYTATVRYGQEPNVTEIPVAMQSDGEDGAIGTLPSAELLGDGRYNVWVGCDVGEHARYAEGEDREPGDELRDAPSFIRFGFSEFDLDLGRYHFPTISGDCDNDGYTDGEEGVPYPGTPFLDAGVLTDSDGDGTPDACDVDSDGDGRLDLNEPDTDTDGDGIDDRLDVDSDDDGDKDGGDRDPSSMTKDRTIVFADFDGDGAQDKAVGDYTYNTSEGIVRVYYGDSLNGDFVTYNRDTGSLLGSDADYNYFGRALAAGDIDGDGFDDLVVGVPYDDINGSNNAGSIHVIYGSANGLVTTGGDQLLHQDSPGLLGYVEPYDYFGERLTIADFNCDGLDDVVVGVPREGLSSSDTGIVAVIYGSFSGLSTTDAIWYQGTAGVDGVAESYDRFGEVLKTGDFDGNGCADLAVGVPWEHLNATADTGYVYTMLGGVSGVDPANGDFGFFQSTSGIAGTVEAWDKMGQRFWTDDWDGDGYDDLTTLVPGDGCGAGTKGFLVTYGSASGVTATASEIHCLSAVQEMDL